MEKTKKKKKKGNFVFIMIFVLGALVFLYPLISRLYYRVESNEQVASYEKAKAELSEEEIQKRMDLAQAFNDSLSNTGLEDPYSKERYDKGRAEYARMLEVEEKIGHVEIPKVGQDLPIYAGTGPNILEKGVGHLEGTSLPIGGNSSHTVLTAHSGLPTAKLFTDLKDLKVGDKFYIHNIKETLAYQVDQIKVVEPDNFNDLLIVPGHDYATLLTCTPIMINTHRLLVRGHRVEYVKEAEEKLIAENKAAYMYKYLFYLALLIIVVLLIMIRRQAKRSKLNEKKIKELSQSVLEIKDKENEEDKQI
ncbi:MAG: class C sortase [Finegoldia sp.]|nr:class C sortase [Finegoldia sp.]